MYKLYLDNVLFPIPPEKITWEINNKNETMELVNGSEINFVRTPGLTQFSFDLLLPNSQYPFADYSENEFRPAVWYTDLLKTLKTEKEHFKLFISRTKPNGSEIFENEIEVSLENYTVNDSASDGFDISVSVTLKEFIPYGTTTQNIIKASENEVIVEEEKQRTDTKEIPEVYTVKKDDNLWDICMLRLGDGTKYHEIAKLNGIIKPDLIYPGQVIKFA